MKKKSKTSFCKLPNWAYLNLFVLLFILNPSSLTSQTVLTPGDIAVIGFKTNTSTDAGNDAVKLVTLRDLECNTTFIVTDNNWSNSIPGWACNNDEFGIQITCTSPISQGSVFYIDVSASGAAANCSGGTITRTDLGNPWGTDYGMSSGGDNIYVLQGTRAAPVFIYAIKNNSSFSANTCTNKDQAGLPAGLTLGTSAIAMSSSQNQWHYNCVTNNTTRAAMKTAISTAANWVSTGGQSWTNQTGIFTITDPGFSYGVLAVSGPGCGCLANCNLAYSGGVNCGAVGVSGNCTAGYQSMSKNIIVPSGCTYSVTAEMKLRPNGCTSGSGADGNCQGCDNVKVDILGGVKLFQQAGSDLPLIDSYSATGPATIVVSGSANRADEIITYSIRVTPCNCVTTVLPIELTKFEATLTQDKTVNLTWTTATEFKNEYFTIEKSKDAITWEVLNSVSGFGDSHQAIDYSIFDSSPYEGISYYRLKQSDMDGRYSYFGTVSVNNSSETKKIIKRTNIYGQEVDENETGIVILIYDNGDVRKIIK
ncbi:MAG: hypothetical protein SFY56_02080 [Bacteroidota bacterium]|nr:hypothetical protein [Bacteroidota bacterium]